MMPQGAVAVFHPGTQHSWQTALALQQLGRLEFYATSIFYRPGRWPYLLERLPGTPGQRLAAEFRRFSHPGIDPELVLAGGWHEWAERLAARAGLQRLARRIDALGNRAFVGQMRARIESDRKFALWGYDGSSLTSFRLGRAHGRTCILDKTVGHRRALNRTLRELREQWPEWAGPASDPLPPRALEVEEEELALADLVVTGSDFARETLIAESAVQDIAEKTKVLPYCFDAALFGSQPAPVPVPREGPVKFLLVGQLGLRKGIHLLLDAISRLPRGEASLTLVGPLQVPPATFARYSDRVTHIPSVPRSKVPAIMAAHHVLVFPSYFEGSALALLEALASGLGIIQSRQAGNGVTAECGIVLEKLDTVSLTEAMRVPIRDRDLLDAWRLAAQREARRYSFARYCENIAPLLDELGI